METEQNLFVYVDYREDDGRPFYVGKGLEKRVKKERRSAGLQRKNLVILKLEKRLARK